MASYLGTSLRKIILERANYRCEYCLLPQKVSLYKHEPDHILPKQHGGENVENNLALACMQCNRFKGPNIGSFDPLTKKLVPFFNPRTQKWADHFKWDGAIIQPLTPEGRVTVKIMRLNNEDRITERESLLEANLYF